MPKNAFAAGSRWGSLQRSPKPLTEEGLSGKRGKERRGRGGLERGGKGREGEGLYPPPRTKILATVGRESSRRNDVRISHSLIYCQVYP